MRGAGSPGAFARDERGRSETQWISEACQRRGPPEVAPVADQDVPRSTGIQHDVVIDGKVVKSSYNTGARERFVHVTEIRSDENGSRSRFIIGARPTELDRNGEWGAAVSVLEALTPLPDDMVIVVGGDAGFCVEEFCRWLNAKDFLHLPDQGERR